MTSSRRSRPNFAVFSACGPFGGTPYPNGMTTMNGWMVLAARRLSRMRFARPSRDQAFSSAFAPWNRYNTGYRADRSLS
jgi:hypothetical protein